MPKDDFRNFLLIKKLEEDKKDKTFLSVLFQAKWIILLIVVCLIILYFIYNIFFTKINLNNEALKNSQNLFQVKSGESINFVGQKLADLGIIKSALAFKVYVKVFSNKTLVQAGIYELNKKDNLVSLANKIIKADYAIPPVKITIPEGSNNQEIANIINKAFETPINNSQLIDDFSVDNIYTKLLDKQGYLFPETYTFLPNISLNQVIEEMKSEFYFNLKNIFTKEDKTLGILSLKADKFIVSDYFDDTTKTINLNKRFTIKNDIGTITVTIQDVITMASYLEGEANNDYDMRMVAGVLWTRLKLNYPLQIDAATSTYKERGFTKTPINNPGLVAIRAAISPINSGNIYYITGNDGKMYYAEDYLTHLDNINKHLRNR